MDLKGRYERDGFLSPVRILDAAEAGRQRAAMEAAEVELGRLHYKFKIHTVLAAAFDLATRPAMLDVAEALLGPDILLYNVTYIVKEPGTRHHVSWHQDLTYWGLSSDRQVSAWLALSPATAESGCMSMIPGSHREGRLEHRRQADADNILFHGQTATGFDESRAALCPLAPGEASFHHGWTLHASLANRSADRRIGLNVQYLATDVRQTLQDEDSAILVRGEDRYRHFKADRPAASQLDHAAWAAREAQEALFARAYTQAAGLTAGPTAVAPPQAGGIRPSR